MLARDSWRAEPSIFPRRSGPGGRRGWQEPCQGPPRSAGCPETPETAEQPPATPVSRPLTMPEPSAHNEPADVGIGEAAYPRGGGETPPVSGWGWAYSGAQAWLRPPLIPDWPREPDASAKEAQVGRPGGVDPLEGEMVLLRGSVGTPNTIIPMDQRPVMH